ncbi:MFS transporter [Nocardioides yefusunii]|uniref:MFS transporter n=1 Tax=Nocardioides yefusunii TaxID=2500546 RepID=A0ABW1R327_9ACTN|nr:MFS transporter [Nocardioides yefusunii]
MPPHVTTPPVTAQPVTAPPGVATGRRTPLFPFLVVASALVLMAAQAAAPTPLYPLYAERWGFDDFTTSQIFTVYIASQSVMLFLFGSLSDFVGRKPVSVIAVGLVVVAAVVLATADSLGDLLWGRTLQGLASGLGFGTLGAALLDQSPPHRHHAVAVINSSVPPLAQGIGALVSGLAVEFLPHPFWLGYAVVAVLSAIVLVGVWVIPERSERRPKNLRAMLPTFLCPPSSRSRFGVAAWALCASWALLGLYLGVGPTIARELFDVSSPSMAGLLVLLVSGAAAVLGATTFGVSGERMLRVGSVALVVGVALMVVAVSTASFALFCVASVVGGVGFGGGFQGGVKVLMAVTVPSERGGTLSLLYLVAYVAFGLPTLVAGLAVPALGLGPVVDCYAALIALLAVAGLVSARTLRAGVVHS